MKLLTKTVLDTKVKLLNKKKRNVWLEILVHHLVDIPEPRQAAGCRCHRQQ